MNIPFFAENHIFVIGLFTLGNLILSSQWVIPEKSLGNLTMGIRILDNRALSNLTLSDYNRDNTTLGN